MSGAAYAACRTEGEIEEDEGIDVERGQPDDIDEIQRVTMTVWAMRNLGVPKKRANALAFKANQSSPKTDCRCR